MPSEGLDCVMLGFAYVWCFVVVFVAAIVVNSVVMVFCLNSLGGVYVFCW